MKNYSEINLLVGAKTKTQSYTQSFDAWGRERNPQTWDYTPNPIPKPAWLIRGYTGHEMLPEFGLINMNGRMYDPVLGRMLSPDNFVQDATNTQSYNRYSYCWNNPLKYTDPSGELVHMIVGAVIGGISGFIAGDMAGASGWKLVGYIAAGAAIGAVTAGVSSGVNASLSSGSSGFVKGFMGTAINTGTGFASGAVSGLAGGLTGGFLSGTTYSLLQGANFRDALVSGLDKSWKNGLIGFGIGGILGAVDAVTHKHHWFTGSPRDYLVIGINENGTSMVITRRTFDQNYTDKSRYITKLNSANSTVDIDSDGYFITKVKVATDARPVAVKVVSPRPSEAGVLENSLNGQEFTFKSINKINSVFIEGYRYYSNPVTHMKNLFWFR